MTKYTMLQISTTPQISTLQFMLTASRYGKGTGGKKEMARMRTRKATENRLMYSPDAPRSNREGSRGCRVSRRQTTQDMQTMYDSVKVPVPSEAMLLNATVLPMLMRAMMVVNANDTMTVLIGTSYPGRTFTTSAVKEDMIFAKQGTHIC